MTRWSRSLVWVLVAMAACDGSAALDDDLDPGELAPDATAGAGGRDGGAGAGLVAVDGGSAPDPTPREVIYRFLDEGDLASADKILGDVWPVNRYDDARLPSRLTWTENPYGEKFWRFIFYGFRPVAHLLWAYRTTGDVRYRDKLLAVVTSFVDRAVDSPFVWDKHTTAYRTMMLVNIHAKLGQRGDLTTRLDSALRAEIANHGVFLANPRNYEPGYNHGLAEAAALLLVAESYPALPGAAAWRATALDRITTLLDEAVDVDGVEVEQSPYYHFYFLTGFWDLYRWARQGGLELFPGADQRVLAMLRYAAHIAMPDGTLPLMGASLARNIRRSRDTHYDEMAMLDPELDYAVSGGSRGRRPPERHVLFPSSGQAILHSAFRTSASYGDDTHLVVDVGPYRTNHSHLDALAVHVYAAGRPQLVDSGLFSYEAGAYFDYFHGTAAHNTVIVDNRDQREGTAIAGLGTQGPDWAYQSGRHTLYDGVVHRRAVVLVKTDVVLVIDDMASTTRHSYDQAWHLPPAATVTFAGLDALTSNGGRPGVSIRQLLPSGATVSQRRGTTAPIDGWSSSAYEVKEPATALRYRKTGGIARYATLILAGSRADDVIETKVNNTGDNWTVAVCDGTFGDFTVRIRSLASAGESVEVGATAPNCGN